MVTRLQSDKGSFVQSPKGAFDSEPPPTVDLGSGEVIAMLNSSGRLHLNDSQQGSTTNCSVGVIFGTGQGTQQIEFRLDNQLIPVTPEQMLAATYTGVTSGAVYRAADYPGGALLHWCITPTNSVDAYISSDFTSDGSGRVTGSQIVVLSNVGTGTAGLQANLSAGGLSPEFILGEQFTAVINPP